ncbi:MAG: type II toxin-antitoxin system VapC family toxin [Candidatus Ozemobacteraceae bacterium]
MKFLLDTNVCIQWMNGEERLRNRAVAAGSKGLFITNSILAELFFGAFNSGRVDANLARVETFIQGLNVMGGSQESARIFGRIKADLRKAGKPTQDFDLLIASVALASDFILVTGNQKHFESIPGLRIENWQST